MNLFSTKIETGVHILKLNDAINMPQHNLQLLTSSVVYAQKRVISPTELMSVPRRQEGEAGTNYRGPAFRKGARLSSICFCVCRYCHYLWTVQINPFRQVQATHQLTVFLFSVNIFFPVSPCQGARTTLSGPD
jgi:hypothetical protein